MQVTPVLQNGVFLLPNGQELAYVVVNQPEDAVHGQMFLPSLLGSGLNESSSSALDGVELNLITPRLVGFVFGPTFLTSLALGATCLYCLLLLEHLFNCCGKQQGYIPETQMSLFNVVFDNHD